MKRNMLIMMLFLQSGSVLAASDVVTQLVKASCDKNVVLLGELPSHGEARAFQLKAQTVQQLVDQCDFKAVYFEAPVYDFWRLQSALDDQQAQVGLLENAIGGFWHNQELAEWRFWLLDQAQNHGLVLRGLDDQVSRSSYYARNVLPQLASNTAVNGEHCSVIIERNLFWKYNEQQPFDQDEQGRLLQCAQTALDRQGSSASEKVPHADQLMVNLTNLYARQLNHETAADRDAMMWQNFQWQQQLLEPGSKAIIWTSTVHAAKRQGPLPTVPLGQWIHEQTNDSVMAVGFTAFSGQSSMAGMPATTFTEAPNGSLEHVITDHRASAYWLLNQQQLSAKGMAASRLFGPFKDLEWHHFFDYVVVIREEVAPIFR